MRPGPTSTSAFQASCAEFSCNDINPDNAQVVDLMDQAFTSWTAWAYYPKDIGSDCPKQGLLRRNGDPDTAKQDKLDALAIPYAVATAGTPFATRLSRATRTYQLSYHTVAVPGTRLCPGAQTVIFVPVRMYPRGYVAQVPRALIISVRNARASSSCTPWRRTVRVTITARRA